MYASKEATLSSQIEGTQATLGDCLQANTKVSKFDENSSDVQEILNYLSAMNYGIERIKKLPFSLRLIKEMNRKLLSGADRDKKPGEFRHSQNWIGGKNIQEAIFVPPPHHEIGAALSDLEKFFYENKK